MRIVALRGGCTKDGKDLNKYMILDYAQVVLVGFLDFSLSALFYHTDHSFFF